jgi:O-6-methylguanine DNA methyltransferase
MMETDFKRILAVIDRVAAQQSANDLFAKTDALTDEEQILLEKWAGKSIGAIKTVLHPAYGKVQLALDPFTGNEHHAPMVFHILPADANPAINYSLSDSPYGKVIVASTEKGVCFLVFYSGALEKVAGIVQKEFPGSLINNQSDDFQKTALAYINGGPGDTIQLHLRGTDQQLQIWKALAGVAPGRLISYGKLAKATNQMAQDIGSAMGDNRIAMLIPCHRVIKTSGELGQYHWGPKRKQAMLLKEACQL